MAPIKGGIRHRAEPLIFHQPTYRRLPRIEPGEHIFIELGKGLANELAIIMEYGKKANPGADN